MRLLCQREDSKYTKQHNTKRYNVYCEICHRLVPEEYLEKHHLVPKAKHGTNLGTIFVCCSCGNQLHLLFSNKQLAKEYNTLEKILANEKIQKWIKWVQNKPNDFSVCSRRKK